jgi:transcription elongation factor
MNKNLKILVMFFVIACIVFATGCTGNSKNEQNPAQGTPAQNNNQPPANNNMIPHHRQHMNGSERPDWNNGSGRPDWNNTSERPNWNGSERPDWNNTSVRP